MHNFFFVIFWSLLFGKQYKFMQSTTFITDFADIMATAAAFPKNRQRPLPIYQQN